MSDPKDFQGRAFKMRLSRPGKRAVTLGMGTPDPATAKRIVAFVKAMKDRRRWDIIDVLMDKRGSLPVAYDNHENGTLEEWLKEISSPDLDPLVTEWSKTANAKYVKQVRAFIRHGEAFPSNRFVRGAISHFLHDLKTSGSTKVRYRAALSVFAGWLVERQVLDSNPVREVRAAKANPAREVYLEREEAQKLVGQSRRQNKKILNDEPYELKSNRAFKATADADTQSSVLLTQNKP